MQKKPQFTVDESIDAEMAEKALKNLRRMVRYGRMAERAMKSIAQKGYYDGLTPLADGIEPFYGGRFSQGKKKSEIRFARLPMRQPISREDLGPMSDLRLELGKIENTSYSGNSCKEVQLYINGPMAIQQKSALPVYTIEEDCRKIGSVRINKGHLSWLENDRNGNSGGAWRIYKEMKYAGARDSLVAFAKGVSLMLCVRDKGDDGTLVYSAKTLELQETAWEWFLADGYAEKFFREIHELIRVAEVMDS
jgi:hypothetical protein